MLIPDSKGKTGRTRLLAATALGLALAGPAFAFDLPPALIGGAPAASQPERIHVAQSQEAAQLAVRIQQLEEQIRVLTGQVEGLSFQLTQMQTLIARMQEDNEFRFQQLEGGAPANPNGAATESGGETPAGASPQDESDVAPTVIPDQPVRPLPGEQEFDPTFTDGGATPPSDTSDTAAPTSETVGESADPLLGTGAGAEGAVLGELPVAPPADGQPLNLTFTPNRNTGNPDADAQFTAAYEAVQRGDTEFAEEQFRQFIALYPDNPQAPDAANWLGDALLQKGENEEAAEMLLNAYQIAPESARAPDLLLRLGIALARAEERETACRTFAEIPGRFPNLTEAFRARLTSEMATAECPPA